MVSVTQVHLFQHLISMLTSSPICVSNFEISDALLSLLSLHFMHRGPVQLLSHAQKSDILAVSARFILLRLLYFVVFLLYFCTIYFVIHSRSKFTAVLHLIINLGTFHNYRIQTYLMCRLHACIFFSFLSGPRSF